MKYKQFFYLIFIILFSFKVDAITLENRDIAIIKVHVVQSYPHYELLRLEITPELIIKYPDEPVCRSNQNCSQEIGEIKHYNEKTLFNSTPAIFLSGSNSMNPNENDGGGYKIDVCFSDGSCNSWGIIVPYTQYSEDVDNFMKKIDQILWSIEK